MFWGILMRPQCRRALVVWALLLPPLPMLGPGSLWAASTLCFLVLMDRTVKGKGGAFALWNKEDLWLAEWELHPWDHPERKIQAGVGELYQGLLHIDCMPVLSWGTGTVHLFLRAPQE